MSGLNNGSGVNEGAGLDQGAGLDDGAGLDTYEGFDEPWRGLVERQPGTDRRFTHALNTDIGEVLAAHGYPPQTTWSRRADAEFIQRLHQFLYGGQS